MTKSSKRLSIFAHFDKNDRIDDHVVYYLRKLKEVCDSIIFVSTSALPEEELQKINGLIDRAISRKNIGYDFMSWKAGLESVDNIEEFDELVICNDSVYGPLFPLSDLFSRMQNYDCDFWGLTENHDIAYHLQSYFLVFKKNVLTSKTFKSFWETVTALKNKRDIIEQYEVGLSQVLINRGFRPRAYASFKPSILDIFKIFFQNISLGKFVAEKYKKHSIAIFFIKGLKACITICINHKRFLLKLNPTHFYWKKCIRRHMPFVKIELLRDNHADVNIENYVSYIANYSDYDIELIKNHLALLSGK